MIAAPSYILAIVAMIGASQFSDRGLIVGWLALLHLLLGATVAGVTLASTNIALKLSPRGSATAYVATNVLATAAAAGLAPIIGACSPISSLHGNWKCCCAGSLHVSATPLSDLISSEGSVYFSDTAVVKLWWIDVDIAPQRIVLSTV